MTRIKSKKTEEKELDEIWKTKVKERDNHTCQICRKKLEKNNCHAHHILPIRMKGMRWDVDNGLTLCYAHHKAGIFSAHQNAIWFFGWMHMNKPRQLNHCIEILKKRGAEV